MADTEYFGRTQVGTISTPALGQGEVGGTSHLNNAAGRSRPRKGRAPAMGSTPALSSPLRLSSMGEIIGASKLGQRLPQQKTPGEQMSDADEPTQAVKSAPDGTGFVHHRRNSYSDGVTSTPIGSGYPNLNYDSMPVNVGELQSRLGIPSIFSPEEVA
jgi:hypothetical protein